MFDTCFNISTGIAFKQITQIGSIKELVVDRAYLSPGVQESKRFRIYTDDKIINNTLITAKALITKPSVHSAYKISEY